MKTLNSLQFQNYLETLSYVENHPEHKLIDSDREDVIVFNIVDSTTVFGEVWLDEQEYELTESQKQTISERLDGMVCEPIYYEHSDSEYGINNQMFI